MIREHRRIVMIPPVDRATLQREREHLGGRRIDCPCPGPLIVIPDRDRPEPVPVPDRRMPVRIEDTPPLIVGEYRGAMPHQFA